MYIYMYMYRYTYTDIYIYMHEYVLHIMHLCSSEVSPIVNHRN